MRLRAVTMLLPLWFAACAAFAQDPVAPAPTAALAPARDITIDLVVRDRKGRPFRKLQPADVEIKDDGAPVKLEDLRLVSSSGQGQAAPGQAPREQTIALVFDGGMPESRRTRQVAEEIVKRAGPGTWFAVFHAGLRLSVVVPYTQDRAAVRAAIEKAAVRPSRKRPRGAAASAGMSQDRTVTYAIPPQDTQAGRLVRISFDAAEEAGRLAAEENTTSPLAGLLPLARTHTRFEGNKTAVLFSEGLQMTTRLRVLLRDTIAAANRANLSIFVLDTSDFGGSVSSSAAAMLNGLGGVGMGAINHIPLPGQGLTNKTGFLELDRVNDRQSSLRELANGTGGFYQGDVPNATVPARRLIDAVETRYEARFASPATDFDGRYRPLTVTLKNRSLRVQTRSGYVALPPGALPDTRPYEIPLLAVLAAGTLPDAVRFRSRVLNMGRNLALVVEIPLRDLAGLEDASSRLFSLHFSVLARIRGAGGETLRTFSQEFPYRIALERRGQTQAGVFTFYRRFSLPAGDYTLESIVLDQNSNRVGAERKAMRVDPVPPGPLVSDICLVRELEPLPGEGREDPDYFVYKNSKVILDAGNSFSASAGAPLRFFLTVDPLAGGRPDLGIRISHNGRTVAESSLQPSPETAGHAVPLLFAVPAAGLSSGEYEIRVRASQNGQVREKTAAIQVAGGPAPAAEATGPVVADLQPVGAAPEAPEPGELRRILDGIAKRALEYSEHLPNFGCLVVTRRWVDPSGAEQWRPKDSYVELVRIVDNEEEHQVVEVDGKRSTVGPHGMRSSGEFGGLLKMALDEAYQPQVQWKERALLGNRLVYVFAYRVERDRSVLNLSGNLFAPGSSRPAYHGLLYVEPDTLNIRRLTMVSEIPPTKSANPEVAIGIDYDYIALGQRDHVLPVQAELRVRTERGAVVMNQLEFRDYRRFSAQSNIKFDDPR